MAIPDPVINFRGPRCAKDALDLMAKRRGTKPGMLTRQWFLERLISEQVIERMRGVGFEEMARRLHVPSHAWTHPDESKHSPHDTRRLVKKP